MNDKEILIMEYNKLSWQDKSKIIFNYHIRRQLEEGCAISGHSTVGTRRLKDTAKDLNMSKGLVSFMIDAAQLSNTDPKVYECKTIDEAKKYMGKK